MKGIKSSDDIKEMEVPTKVGIAFGVGCGVAILLIPMYMKLRKRILARRRSKGCGRGGRSKEHQGSCPAEREERSVDEEYWAHLYLWQKEE